MQDDPSHHVLAVLQQVMGFADLQERQDGMDRHYDSTLLEEFDNNSLIVSRRGAHTVHVEFAANQIDYPQWNRFHRSQLQAMILRTASQILSAVGVMASSSGWLNGVGTFGRATRMIGARNDLKPCSATMADNSDAMPQL
jgi:hypothetical protein